MMGVTSRNTKHSFGNTGRQTTFYFLELRVTIENERLWMVQAQTRPISKTHEVEYYSLESWSRELHKEIIRLHDVNGIGADCELTEVLRELAEIMIHGEKKSVEYFEYGIEWRGGGFHVV